MKLKKDNYIKWLLQDCSNPYEEIGWLLNLLLDSKHKEDITTVLNDVYELYKDN